MTWPHSPVWACPRMNDPREAWVGSVLFGTHAWATQAARWFGNLVCVAATAVDALTPQTATAAVAASARRVITSSSLKTDGVGPLSHRFSTPSIPASTANDQVWPGSPRAASAGDWGALWGAPAFQKQKPALEAGFTSTATGVRTAGHPALWAGFRPLRRFPSRSQVLRDASRRCCVLRTRYSGSLPALETVPFERLHPSL
jgi:hypothetical protein